VNSKTANSGSPAALLVFQSMVLMSPTFYERLFHTKMFLAAIQLLEFGFVIFWHKDIGKKVALKMLVIR
jgi:hypothetical protein